MSVIRPIAPPHCPECDATGTLFIDKDRRLTCKLCAYKELLTLPDIDPGTPVDAPETLEKRRQSYVVTWGILSAYSPDTWVNATYESGLYAAKRGEWDEAIASFQRTIDQDKDFVDAHLWLARLHDDDAVRRDHYGTVLANLPNHLESIRELMVLNGQLTAEESARAGNAAYSPAVVDAGMAVAAHDVEVACEICNSHDLIVRDGQTICQTCGNAQTMTDNGRGYGLQSMTMAMIKKRGQRIEWIVGEHILHCDNCGAERIIQKKMSSQCPFCGSKNVLQSDVLDSFQQPDGVIPFLVTKQTAQDALENALNSRFERFKGMFVNNSVERISYTPVYIPFWYFDAVLQVSKTIRDDRARYGTDGAYQRTEFTEMAHNIPVAGVKSPAPKSLMKIMPYEMDTVRSYDPALLARYQAEIYSLDFDHASLDARSQIAKDMRFKHGHNAESIENYSVHVGCLFQQMSFRLLLLPVVVATILEKDGDVRPVLINGQTAKVTLGRARKPG